MSKLNNKKQKQGGIFIKSHGPIEGAKITDNLISPGSTLLEVNGIKDSYIERNENLPGSGANNLYTKILEWAFKKTTFNEQELFNSFPQLKNSVFKNWYLGTFRGGDTNDESLIGIYDDKKGSFYCSLTAKGRSAYSNLKAPPNLNIEKMEVVNGDKIGRDKIVQYGKENKASIKNSGGENFFSKFFWEFLIVIIVALIIAYIKDKLGWK
jgi:hypothetical protein